MLIHNDEQRFHCQLCDYPCRLKGALKQDMVKHTGMKNFYCHICGLHLAAVADSCVESVHVDVIESFFSLHSASIMRAPVCVVSNHVINNSRPI